MAYLLQQHTAGREATARLYRGKNLRIGRGTNNTLRLDDPAVAMEHALISQSAAGYVFHTRDRAGGTWINDRPAPELHPLADGDRIDLATFTLRVEWSGLDSPLILQVGRLEETPDEDPTAITKALFREPPTADEAPEPAFGETTLPTAVSRDLVARAERYRAREMAAAAAAARPARIAPAVVETSRPVAETHPGEKLEAARIDYGRRYRLEGGLLRLSAVTVIATVALVGTLLAAVRDGRREIFSPGALANVHQKIGNDCGACHTAWQRVEDPPCRQCHPAAGVHQSLQADPPRCADCHPEHRGGETLRLAEERSCVDCHGGLEARLLGRSVYQARITDFTPGEHPEFALDLAGGARARLSEEQARTSDPGGLEGFDHDRHLNRLPSHVEGLVCVDCHPVAEEGEILAVRFEESCQRCHNLTFNHRYPAQQAPHAPAADVLFHITGVYSQLPDVLRNTRGRERILVGSQPTRELKIQALARLHSGRLVRATCDKCHGLEPEVWDNARIADLTVRPVGIRDRWLPHARFLHAPHLERGMACLDCHGGAPASRETGDVLLPGIATCFECHRPPRPGEPALENVGRTSCSACHLYHPEPGERAARGAAAQEPGRGGP